MSPVPSDSDQLDLPWIKINDSEISSEQLQTEISKRAIQRRAQLGRIDQHFPTFGNVSPCPDPPTDVSYSPNLYHHLQALNRSAPPDTSPILASSISTRLPVIGRLWQTIRREAHNLVLFYVNKIAAHSSTETNHIVNILNELTQVTQEQQRTIIELRGEVKALKRENKDPDED